MLPGFRHANCYRARTDDQHGHNGYLSALQEVAKIVMPPGGQNSAAVDIVAAVLALGVGTCDYGSRVWVTTRGGRRQRRLSVSDFSNRGLMAPC